MEWVGQIVDMLTLITNSYPSIKLNRYRYVSVVYCHEVFVIATFDWPEQGCNKRITRLQQLSIL